MERTVSRQSTPSRASSESDSSLQQLSDDIDECVSCLVKLRPIFDDPVPQDMYEQETHARALSEDISFARMMFPKAKAPLSNRLGSANWRRRQALLRLKSGDSVFSSPNPTFRTNDQQDIHLSGLHYTTTRPSRTWMAVLSSHDVVSSPGSSSAGRGSVDDSVFSKQDYFSSSSATSISGSEHITVLKHFDIPKAPVTLKPDRIFNCSYCGQEIIVGLQIDTDEDWDAHVLLDLEPYICTFDDCFRGQRPFGFKEDWWQHEMNHHRLEKVWYCQSCNHTFDEAEDIELHLREKHKLSGDPEQLTLMIALCEKHSDKGVEDQSCALCGSSLGSAKELRDHIADHMEQLALSSIEAVYGPVESRGRREEEKYGKGDLVSSWFVEQRSLLWKPSEQAHNNGSDGSDLLGEDSDDEVVGQNLHIAVAEQSAPNPTQRPGMGKRGSSWVKRSNTFLDSHSLDQLGGGPSFPMPQTYSESQPIQEPDLQDDPESSDEAFWPPSRVQTNQVVPVAVVTHCLRTRPPSRNEDFVGRDSDFKRLNEALSEPGAIVVLSGAGGIGKTDIAVEYTYRYQEAYSYIFWVSAETPISCADTYSIIATELIISEDDFAYGQDRLISLGREFLEQTDAKWLLVFDNACSWSDLQQFIPIRPHETTGSILITARTSDLTDVPSTSSCRFLELNPLTLEESRLFLLKSMQRDLKVEEVRRHPEYGIAGAIAKESEGLPLALSHIAGYIQVSQCTLTEFVQLWNERRRHKNFSVPRTNIPIASTNKTLEIVWNIGLREVTIDARELLNILAFLDCDHIQRKLLVGDHEEASLEFLHSDQSFR